MSVPNETWFFALAIAIQRTEIEQVIAKLKASQEQLRQAVTNLRTAPESEEELIPLADQRQAMVDETEIPATVAAERVIGLTPLQTDAMRRTAQEALTNIVKHGASENYVSSILGKLGAANRTQAVSIAREREIL